MSSTLSELVAKLKIDVDDKQLNSFVAGFGPLIGKLKDVAGGIAAAFAINSVKDFIVEQAHLAGEVDDVASRLGVARDALEQWRYIVTLTDGDLASADNSLKFFNKNLGEASLNGGEFASIFSSLGVQIKDSNGHLRSQSELLPEVAEAFKNMPDHATRTALGMKIFGKSAVGILPTLKLGKEGLLALQTEFEDLGGGFDEEFMSASSDAEDNLQRFNTTVASAKGQLAKVLLPSFDFVVKKLILFGKWVNKTIKTTTVFKSIVRALGLFMGGAMVYRVLVLINTFSRFLSVLKLVQSGILSAFRPMVLWAAAAVALYLIFDDLYALMNGNNSLLGEYLDKTQGVGSAAKMAEVLRGAWSQVKDAFVQIGPSLSSIFQTMQNLLPYAIDGFIFLAKIVASLVISFGAFVSTLSQMGQAIKTGDFKGIKNTIGTAIDQIAGKNVSSIDLATGAVSTKSVGGIFGASVATPGASANVTQDNKTTININGITDPNSVANAVGGKLGELQSKQNKAALSAIPGAR